MLRVQRAPNAGPTTWPRASSWSATRSPTSTRSGSGSRRSASRAGSPRSARRRFTVAYEVFDDDGGGPARSTSGRRTVLTPYVFATERPRRITAGGARDARAVPGARPSRVRTPPGGAAPEGACRYPVHVRFSDVDVYGHVNNVKYFEYFQEARISLFADLGWEHRTSAVSTWWSPRRTSTTAGRSSSGTSPTTCRSGSPRSAHLDDASTRRSATATRCCRGAGPSRSASTPRPSVRRRCPRACARPWSPCCRSDHSRVLTIELRRVGDVVPELRRPAPAVRSALVEPRAEVRAASGRARPG